MRQDITIEVGEHSLRTGCPALLVAEIGGNHAGDPALAARMVEAAAACGAGAVKFQAYRTAEFLSPLNPYYSELATEELPFEHLAALVAKAHGLGLAAGLTVFDQAGLDLVRDCQADFIKISSGDLTNLPLLALAAKAERPLFISTGAAEAGEVAEAMAIAEPAQENLVLLQCAALYPAPLEAANLEVMVNWLAAGLAAGYSDHCQGPAAAEAALTLGALVLEKHFTLDRDLPGGDNSISAQPEEFARLVSWANRCVIIRGQGGKHPHPLEMPMRPLIRRAVVAARNLPAGHRLKTEDLALRRPPPSENPLEPKQLPNLLGRQLKSPLAEGAPLAWSAVMDETDG